MESFDGTIKKITQDEATKIIEIREPLGLFYLKDGKVYVGIDNSDGEAWTEEFKCLSTCKKWLGKYVGVKHQ